MTSSQNNKRIAKNTIALTLRMFFTMSIGIYSSRILLANLGVTDYGINNVVAGIITMFMFLNTSLINGTQRYLNFYLGKNNIETLNKVFSTSIHIFLLLAIFVAVLGETAGIYFLNTKLDIPKDRLIAANWLFQLTIISTFINIISTPYNALIIAKEKMTIFAYVSIANSIYLLLAALAIPYIPYDHLIGYAILIVTWHIIIRLFYSWYCSSHFKTIKYKFIFDKSLFKEMFVFSGWTLTGTFTYMTYTQGLTFLINIFFGPSVNAAQALAQQVNGSLNAFSANFMIATKPQITKYYAEGNLNEMHKLIFFSSKMSYAIMAIVSLPFIIRTDYILGLWLKEIPKHTAFFLQLYLIIAIINTLSSPAITAIHSTGKIKWFQIYESLVLILILPFSYLAIQIWNIPESCYIVTLILIILAQFIRIYFMKQLIELCITEYLKNIFCRMILSTLITVGLSLSINILIPNNFIGFCVESCICISIFSINFFFIGLTKAEQNIGIKFIQKKIFRK